MRRTRAAGDLRELPRETEEVVRYDLPQNQSAMGMHSAEFVRCLIQVGATQ